MRKFRYRPAIVNGNPIVKFLFEEMHRQQCCQMDLSERVGLHRDTLRNWRTRHTPSVDSMEAALNYLGYTLKVVRLAEAGEDVLGRGELSYDEVMTDVTKAKAK